MSQWMIYAANGYLGKKLAEEVVRLGHQPIIAGRDELSIMSLAEQLDLSYQSFDLVHDKVIKDQLQALSLIVNCGHVSSAESDRLYQAALQSGCHYIGLSDDADSYAKAFTYADRAVEKGVVILPSLHFTTVTADVYVGTYIKAMQDQANQIDSIQIHYQQPLLSSPADIKSLLQQVKSKTIKRKVSDGDRYLVRQQSAALSALDKVYALPAQLWQLLNSADEKVLKRFMSMSLFLFIPQFFQLRLQRMLKHYQKYRPELLAVTIAVQFFDKKQQLLLNKQELIEDRDQFTLSCLMQAIDALLADKILPGVFHPSQALDNERTFSLNKNNAESDDDFLHIDSEQWE